MFIYNDFQSLNERKKQTKVKTDRERKKTKEKERKLIKKKRN